MRTLIYIRHSTVIGLPLVGGFCLVAVNDRGQAEKKLVKAVKLSRDVTPNEAHIMTTNEALKRIKNKQVDVTVIHGSLDVIAMLKREIKTDYRVEFKALFEIGYEGYAYWYQLPLFKANEVAKNKDL